MAITSRRISGPREVFAKPLLTVSQCRLSACDVAYRPIAPDPRCLQIGRQRSGKRKRPSQLRSGADDNPNSQSASPIDGSRRTVIVGTSALNRLGHGAATVTGKPALNGTTHPSNGELTMKKIILTAAAFASLAAIESAPAAAYGCRTQFVDGRIVSVCNSPMGGTMIGRPRCVQRPGFNQPYICR